MQQPYCTPNRYAIGGFGIDTSFLSRLQLRQKLVQASGKVDTFCNLDTIPSRTDFRGGTVTDEQHAWQVPTGPEAAVMSPGTRRIYLSRRPIVAVTAFKIQFTTSYEITLPASDLYVNAQEGYIEIIASQPTIIGYPPLGYWYGLYQPVTSTTYTYGWSFPVTGDVCEADSPEVFYASHGNWDTKAPVAVMLDDVVQVGGYSLNRDDGSVTFANAPGPGVTVSVDYTYTLPQPISDATAIIATDLIAKSRIAQRGLLGLSSLKVAEVAMTQMPPAMMHGRGPMVVRNGVSIPPDAADLLDPFARGALG